MTRSLPTLCVVLCVASACTPPDAGRGERRAAAHLRVLAAEDARPTEVPSLSTLTDATRSPDPRVRQAAVRALGRLEDPDRIDDVVALLEDVDATVRAEAANAMAQAVHRADGTSALPALIARVGEERDSTVLAALARSIGRTASTPAARRDASTALLAIAGTRSTHTPRTTLVGVALGFESLVRRAGGQGLTEPAAARLSQLATHGLDDPDDVAGERLRGLVYSVLGQARRLDPARIGRGLDDPSPRVRLAAGRYADQLAPTERPVALRRMLDDPAPSVAVEALRHVSRETRTAAACAWLTDAMRADRAPAVRVSAADALARPCPDIGVQTRVLTEAARAVDDAPVDRWQPAAHALVALASVVPGAAEPLVGRYAEHDNPFVRAYGARAATTVRDASVLRTLAEDTDANVRTAAIEGLFELGGHTVDDVLIAQLRHDDPQLLMTSARLLEGARMRGEAATALVDAFERVSGAERETWRDSRMALLGRLAELGDRTLAPRLEPFTTDYDGEVAIAVAELLTRWTGQVRTARHSPLPDEPLPTVDEYRGMVGARIALHMRAGGTVVVALTPEVATTNVFRFVRLAERGYFDGLTFHRWAPNFVLQGGSPNANEYQGDGPYSRDEVGLPPHWRGTVGISTRGRDTGDGQIFVNLVDNVRLDHDYTIVGHVVEGMDVIDAALEGSVIERAEVLRRD